MTARKAKAEDAPVPVAPAEFVEGPPPGQVRMTAPDLPGSPTCNVPDSLVPFHLSRGWTLADAPDLPANDPPSGDNPATPED